MKQDYALVKKAEDMIDGKNIHRIKGAVNLYCIRVQQYNRKAKGCDKAYVKYAEDKLRELVKE